MQLLKGYEGKKTKVNVNGHIVDAVVSIRWEYEDAYPVAGDDFDFGSKKDNLEYQRRFETSELVNIYIQVSVMAEGLEGMDSLGACHVKSNGFTKDTIDIVKWHDMVTIAKEDLVKQILDHAARFPKYLVKAC